MPRDISLESLAIPSRASSWTEDLGSHVTIDTDDVEASGRKQARGLGADQAVDPVTMATLMPRLQRRGSVAHGDR